MERGVICLKEGEIPPEGSVAIIRAHGVSPAIESALAQRGITIVDATCPHVKISQNKARDFAKKAYRVFLAGEENHAEIEGIQGYAEDGFGTMQSCFVVSNPLEAGAAAKELFGREPHAKTALIGQTTISAEEYRAMGEQIQRFFPYLEIVDSICGATAERQKALKDLCFQVDAAIIVGSRESANTQRLLSLALELGKPAWLAETPADIPAEIGTYKTVGISAGASTPDSLIKEVEQILLFV
jgi:4-hydroxy-3-methylbut-2-enyl diphosphate reductase